jgi:hypothetical protein
VHLNLSRWYRDEKESAMGATWIPVPDERPDSRYVSWKDMPKGTAFVGLYLGMETGKHDNVLVKLDDGEKDDKGGVKPLYLPAGNVPKSDDVQPPKLQRLCKRVRVGHRARVVFLGKVSIGDGKTMNDFDVQVQSQADLLPLEAVNGTAPGTEADDDAVPF